MTRPSALVIPSDHPTALNSAPDRARRALLAITIALVSAHVTFAAERPVSFSADIRPILSDKCFQCHGPDEEGREGELRLDRRADAEEVLGTVAESELLRRIFVEDDDERMPPADSKLTLTAAERELLKRWIAAGAVYEHHWAFRPIVKRPLPAAPDPIENEIDHFVAARLQLDGLRMSPAAARQRWIRRVSFDLTGLPPTPEQVEQFKQDVKPGAHERVVDRLLESPDYGERMATIWLDAARYSDTYGYQVDRDRHVWPWRDWVVRAFNSNMPFDRFTTLQLAGDLLPNASDDDILATTFNRLHPQKVEGGSTPEEFRIEYVADRNHTFGTAFLGLALECARCHEHKYDPISQREYYELFAFFNNIDEAGLYSYFTPATPTPTLLMATDDVKRRLADFDNRVGAAEQTLAGVAEDREEQFQQWLVERTPTPWTPRRIRLEDFETHQSGANKRVDGVIGAAIQFSGDDAFGVGVGNFRRHQPFSVALWLKTPDVKDRAVVFHRSRAWTDAGSRGYQLLLEDGRLSASLIHFWPGNAIRVRAVRPLPVNEWRHVVVTYDGSSRAAGLRLYAQGKRVEAKIVRDNLYKNITGGGGDTISLGARFRDRGFTGGAVDEFSVYDRELTPLEAAQLHDGESLMNALEAPIDQLNPVTLANLRAYYLSTTDEKYQSQLDALAKLRSERNAAGDGVTEIMVMRELSPRRETFVLRRGSYAAPMEPVEPGTPSAFPPFGEETPRNRLGLAQWLTRDDHPLTARVTMNRLWQQCFGVGLVRSPEDFGSQGTPPTHPDLLNWLSRDLIDSGWDVKRMLKKIVLSHAYRQSSTASSELLKRDPDNRLLARGPRHRLPAEMIRDNALFVSGLLAQRRGGPPSKPYEVAVSFKPVGRDKGDGLYRRSLYTYWKRTAPAPVMMALDASKRDVCNVKRERTSSPLQALVLLNDPQLVESARVLAQRLLRQHGDDDEQLIDAMFVTLTSRHPAKRESELLRDLLVQQTEHYADHGEAAQALLKVGDAVADKGLPAARLAAAAIVANTLLNYDECIMKR